MANDSRTILRSLEEARTPASDAVAPLAEAARIAPTLPLRLEACRVLGSIAGRAFDATWEVAERAAFALLEIARDADAPAERAGLLSAMGRGFRNLWLLPYVHRRLSDDDPFVAAAAISAAGGLAFPALEEALASRFLGDDTLPELRLVAIAALGRMGAESAASRLAPFVDAEPALAAAALSALTEIRSRAGEVAALEVLTDEPPRDVLVAAIRYLAEIGQPDVLRTLRRLAREEDPELRLAASFASRAFKAETTMKADERILTALTERDRAVRAALARRLRTLPVPVVLEQAELLLSDDPEGVIQIVAEVRAPEVTRLLLRVAADEAVPVAIRARAVGSVEADEAWERDALIDLVRAPCPVPVRVAAAQTLGAFAPLDLVLTHLTANFDDPEPTLRAALLWALQLALPGAAPADQARARAEELVRRALADAHPDVRKRAAYVAGNLEAAALVPELVKLAQGEPERPDLRVAAFVALGEIGSPARFTDLVHLWNREDDPRALGAVSRAIERSTFAEAPPPSKGPVSGPPSLARVHDRLKKLLASEDASLRAAAARVAGLSPGVFPADVLATLAHDAAPRVREQAVIALGRIGAPESAPLLVEALGDADPAIQERAAEALLALGKVAPVLDFVSRTSDRDAALRVTLRVAPERETGGAEGLLAPLGAAIARAGHDHPIYEPLLALKVAVLEATRPAPTSGASVDAAITEVFPTWPRLSAARGFEPLAKSLRTAELLHASIARGGDADHSAAIILWMKCLEGYLHAWLGGRLRQLQQKPQALWELVDRLAWPTYQRWLDERWTDPVAVGELEVEVPLRSSVSVLREFQERRLKSVDSPASVTEWSRLMLFFAVDHPAGPKNVLGVASREAERTARLAHRLQVLAQVRNAVTHRSVAAASTLEAFRRLYYAAFEELTQLA